MRLDRASGKLLWETTMAADEHQPYGGTVAPLIVNDTVVASNIDVTKKNSLVIPITVPDKLINGTIRICATAVTPPAAQICTDVQNTKQGGKNKVTLDLTKAIAG